MPTPSDKIIYMPPTKNVADPKGIKSTKETHAVDWDKKAEEEVSQKRYLQAKKEREEIESGKTNRAEPAFQVKGSVNLGDINIQEQARSDQVRMQAQIDKIKNDSEADIAALSKEAADYRDKVTELRMTSMENQFKVQMESLLARLASNSNDGGTIAEIGRIKEIARELGYQQPAPGIGDPALQLQILKMQNDAAREAREFEWKMKQDEKSLKQKEKQDDRDLTLRAKQIDAEGLIALKKLEAEERRNSMLASFPEMLGAAIAKGFMSGSVPAAAGTVSREASAPAAKTTSREEPASTVGKAIQAAVGEAGETPCPGCSEPIAIAPGTTEAVCAGCGARIPVRRVAANA